MKITTIGDFISSVTSELKKEAFVPNPQAAADISAQDGAAALFSQITEASKQLPPELQAQVGQALQQLQAAPPQEQAAGLQQIAMQLQQAAQPLQAAQPEPQPGQVQTAEQAPPTDMENITVTLRLRDLLDMVSNGKVTQSLLKTQDIVSKQQAKQEKAQAQAELADQQAQAPAAQGQPNSQANGGIY